MQFSWTTFFIEIINFLILVWILKRLFYTPIRNAITQRKQVIQETVEQAKALSTKAELLTSNYENRLKDWEKEKHQYIKDFQREMVDLRDTELAKLNIELAKEKQKSEAVTQQLIKKQIQANLRQAFGTAAKFSAKFLTRLADVDLERKIIEIFLEDLSRLPLDQFQNLQTELESTTTINVQSAFQIDLAQQNIIINSFNNIFANKYSFNFMQQSDLLAGVNVQIGSIILQANLRDELKFFTEVANGSSQIYA